MHKKHGLILQDMGCQKESKCKCKKMWFDLGSNKIKENVALPVLAESFPGSPQV